MKTFPILVTTLAGMAAAGCTAPQTQIAPRNHAPIWQDTGTPAASVVTLEPERRYYRDSTGATWDDHGKTVGGGS